MWIARWADNSCWWRCALLVAGMRVEASEAFGKFELIIKRVRIEINGMANLKFGQCKIKALQCKQSFFGQWSVPVQEYLESSRTERYT